MIDFIPIAVNEFMILARFEFEKSICHKVRGRIGGFPVADAPGRRLAQAVQLPLQRIERVLTVVF